MLPAIARTRAGKQGQCDLSATSPAHWPAASCAHSRHRPLPGTPGRLGADRAVRGWPHPRGDHAVAASYVSNWPVGFFVGTLGAVSCGTGHGWAVWRRTRAPGADPRPLAA
jgi:hypothetical protein